ALELRGAPSQRSPHARDAPAPPPRPLPLPRPPRGGGPPPRAARALRSLALGRACRPPRERALLRFSRARRAKTRRTFRRYSGSSSTWAAPLRTEVIAAGVPAGSVVNSRG